jgi:aldehyde:ferredoxin oxidoreductase
MPFGYNAKILHLNLTTSTWKIETPDPQWYRTYVGGSSLAAYYLLKHLPPGVDPLSEQNVLVFACSVLTGAPLSGFSRYTVAAKSPLTGGFGEAEAGGYFGPELKFAGFDAVVFYGRAPTPVYLWVHDHEVEVRDAAHIWGKNNWETLEGLRKELGDKRIRVASIGQAGERLIPFACVQNDMEHYNGRGGMGAVMGSKNLKAVVARGKQTLELADPDKVREIRKWHNHRITVNPPNVGLSKAGTSGLVKGLNQAGILPTRNFKYGVFNGADKIGGEALHSTIFHSSGTCYACTVKCKRRVASTDDAYPLDARFGGPEYETLGCLGSLLENDNLPALARGNQLCNLYGLDTISTGGVIAFAMECFENGILSEADTGGRPIQFGDGDAMLWLIEEIVHQRGIGKILSQGVKRAAEIIGRGAAAYAFHIKGSEMPVHDGRGKTGVALGYALAAIPDHVETPHDTAFAVDVTRLMPLGLLEPVRPLDTDADKVRFFSLGQKAWGLNNCYGICNFCSVPSHGMTFPRLVETINAITGWETSLFEILRVTERSNVMSRVFNNREGFGPEDDRVIRRWHEAMPGGPLKGQRIDPREFRDAIDLFYELSGWDKKGRPTRGKLVDLNLEWLIENNPD